MSNHLILLLIVTFIFSSCSTAKLITKNNTFFYLNEDTNRIEGSTYSIKRIEHDSNFKASITEKSDYIIITPNKKDLKENYCDTTIKGKDIDARLDLIKKYYYPELLLIEDTRKSSFKYYDIKFGLQALTIPLKFRNSVGNDTINPPIVETGINIGFAPGWKFTKNIYKPSKNYLGKNTTQIAIAIGPHFGLGTADLKKSSNSPGLLSDRKSPTFTWGGYFLFGFNNINLGLAFGTDYVLGTGRSNWVYQGKIWTGIMLSLDILKF